MSVWELLLHAGRLLANPRRTLAKTGRAVKGYVTAAASHMLALRQAGTVVMFHIGRSGSTVLGDLLDQHPQIYWDGEIYERLFAAQQVTKAVMAVGLRSSIDPIRLITKRRPRAGKRYYGFELKRFHLRPFDLSLHEFIARVAATGPLFAIVLERRNYLRKIVSSLIAHRSGDFHCGPSARPSLTRVRLDPAAVPIDCDRKPLLELMKEYRTYFDELENTLDRTNTLRLTYEDDVAIDPRCGYARACRFLGFEPLPTAAVRYGKTNPFRLCEMIENFDEVADAVRGTPFAWMLDD